MQLKRLFVVSPDCAALLVLAPRVAISQTVPAAPASPIGHRPSSHRTAGVTSSQRRSEQRKCKTFEPGVRVHIPASACICLSFP